MSSLMQLMLGVMLGPTLQSGAPSPQISYSVWLSVPLGAPIRVVARANCMARISGGLATRLRVKRGGAMVPGRWVREKGLVRSTGTFVRLMFSPTKPLRAGRYQVHGLPASWGPLASPGRQVTVGPTPDRTPPQWKGLTGAYCVPPHPLKGCAARGIFFKHTPGTDPSGIRYVLYVRRRGKPYSAARRYELDAIPLRQNPFGAPLPKGRYIVTLRARDAADNEGGRPCEVALKLPITSCKAFPARVLREGGFRHGQTQVVRARCARWNQRRKAWISAFDGVKLPFKR